MQEESLEPLGQIMPDSIAERWKIQRKPQVQKQSAAHKFPSACSGGDSQERENHTR